jgi:hypothetical protein
MEKIMEALGVIPARYGATRFEGKLLKDLCGKPVIRKGQLKQTLTFRYAGERCFFPATNPKTKITLRALNLGSGPIDLPIEVRVKIVEDLKCDMPRR